MLAKPMILDCDALGTRRQLWRIGGGESKARLVVFEDGGLDERVRLVFELEKSGHLIENDAER